jgi:internalin A
VPKALSLDTKDWPSQLTPDVEDLSIRTALASDLTPLARLKNLRALWIGNRRSNVSDLSPLSKLPSLERIKIESAKIEDLAPLAKLTNLRVLELSGTRRSPTSLPCRS